MKKYVIILSSYFPKTHPRAGEKTNFENSFLAAVGGRFGVNPKIHTIRNNYQLWEKRFEKINKGEGCLSIRIWEGVPYRSSQKEIALLTKEDGIGLQRLNFYRGNISDALFYPSIDGVPSDVTLLAKNDGLSFEDWKNWFKDSDFSKPFAIIHFTKKRY